MKPRLDLPKKHASALQVILKLVPPREITWALTGSAGLRLLGVDVDVHDLDIQTDEMHLRRIEKRLEKFFTIPLHAWETPMMRSLYGKAEIKGVQIDWMANITHLLPDGTWICFADFSKLLWLDWHGQGVPVFPLDIEAEAYESMGRTEKAGLIRETLRKTKVY
jgi:hypothetical protein